MNKLVRDNLIAQMVGGGDHPKFRSLSQPEFVRELVKKLQEEAIELAQAKPERVISEIADIQQLIDTLLETLGVTKAKLNQIKAEKNKQNGTFKKRLYVENIELQDESQWMNYFLDNYQEIKQEIKK